MRTMQELIDQINKMMDDARNWRRNPAYIKGLRDARMLLEEEVFYDGDTLPES